MANKYDLHAIEWGEFQIGKMCNIFTGAIIPQSEMQPGNIPRISATDLNNGISTFTKQLPHTNYRKYKNFISISFLGSVFYQTNEVSLDMKIHGIEFKNREMNKFLASFVIPLIKNFSSKYSYGYQLSTSVLKKQKILLPKDKSGNPDWDLMEEYMREKEKKQLETALSYYRKKKLNKNVGEMSLKNCEWKAFEIGSLFSLSQGKSKGLNHLEIDSSGVNYLGATNRNNGVMCQVQKNEKMIQRGNCIAFIRNGEGSMGYSLYKAEDFIATSDISVGYSDFLTQNIGLFITTVADRVRGKYNFGYKRSDTRLKKEKILLPVDSKGNPDWNFIELYMGFHQQKLVKKYTDYVENKSI